MLSQISARPCSSRRFSCGHPHAYLLGRRLRNGNLLHCAVDRKHPDTSLVIDLLVHCGAWVESIEFEDPRAAQLRGHLKRGTPLHRACHDGNLEAASALLAHGASPISTRRHYMREDSITPLDLARERGDWRMLSLILSAMGHK